jgi:glycosyltransferase involved in cell wall biosynthesis
MSRSNHVCVERGDRLHRAPRVSVVIPAYRSAWLESALESVRAQTFTSWELLVVDDGSPEPVRPSRMDDLVLIRHPNAGPGGARNRGVEHARGELLAFLDADDRWHASKLERQVAMHDAQRDLVMTCTDLMLTDGQTTWPLPRNVRQRGRFVGDRIPFEHLFYENFIATSTVLICRDAFLTTPGMTPHRRMGEDYAMWLRLGYLGPIGFIDEPLVQRRHHPESLMAQTTRDGSWFDQEREVYDEILAAFPDLASKPFVRAALARLDFQGGWAHLSRGEWAHARRALLRSIVREPRRAKAWFDLTRALLRVRPLGLER